MKECTYNNTKQEVKPNMDHKDITVIFHSLIGLIRTGNRDSGKVLLVLFLSFIWPIAKTADLQVRTCCPRRDRSSPCTICRCDNITSSLLVYLISTSVNLLINYLPI